MLPAFRTPGTEWATSHTIRITGPHATQEADAIRGRLAHLTQNIPDGQGHCCWIFDHNAHTDTTCFALTSQASPYVLEKIRQLRHTQTVAVAYINNMLTIKSLLPADELAFFRRDRDQLLLETPLPPNAHPDAQSGAGAWAT